MTPRTRSSRVGLALATVGYAGFAPVAPGTVGSAVAIPLWWVMRQTGLPWLEPLCLALVIVAGAWGARVTERELQVEDPGPVVIDEVAGMFVTLLWMPVTWPVAIVGFLAFRVFDIVKPYPVGRLERLPGGWGVMADDVMAGVYAWGVLRIVLWLRPEWLV